MKKSIVLVLLLVICQLMHAQSPAHLTQRINAIEDRIALKEIVDRFSTLADVKNVQQQLLLFTEDAVVETFRNGQPAGVLKGREAIGNAFSSFLNLFETVYHINGQQTVSINGNTASGTSYCMVTLIGTENGKKMKTTFGIYYKDEFVRRGKQWLISKRQSHFTWEERVELKQ
jgi:hypothetical protein